MELRNQKKKSKFSLEMTSMIDIVFQLLIFFVMTFKIVAPEGDFNVRMPKVAPDPTKTSPNLLPPISIKMEADAEGELAGLSFGSERVPQMKDLQSHVLGILGGDGSGPDRQSYEVELDCDSQLQYKYVIDAITLVSGKKQGDQIVPLIEKIKFSSPKVTR